MGSTAPLLKKLMRTHATPTIMTCQSPKRKAVQGATQKATTGKRLHRARPSAAQVNDPNFPRTDVQLPDPILSQLSNITSQPPLGAELLSQAFDSAPIDRCFHNGRKYEFFL